MLDLTKYQTLSFDVYGTLIDWEAGIAAVLSAWAQKHGSDLDDEALLLAYADNEADIEANYPTLAYPEVLQAAFRRTAKDLNLPIGDADVQALGASVPNWPAFADSAEALARLKKHYQLVILSNVHEEGVAGSLQHLQVAFDQINTAQAIGSYKPNPKNFQFLLARLPELDSSPEKLLHVAQSLFHDHVPAKEAQLDSVWINRRHDKAGWGATPDPKQAVTVDLEFPSLASFADAVDQAFATQTTE